MSKRASKTASPRPPKATKPPKPPPKTRWERSADRENERRRKKNPLFFHMGLVPVATPEEREAMFGPGFREQLERENEERARVEQERAEELRAQVRYLVSAETFAELEGRAHRYSSEANFYAGILDEIQKRELPSPPPPPPPTARPPPPRQEWLFAELPGVAGVVPMVVDGHAIPIAQVAEEHGIDLTAPVRGEPLPCASCGWKPSPEGTRSVIDFNIHPPDCPSLRGFLLGLSKRCADCKAQPGCRSGLPWGPCPVHLAEILTCDREGHVEGPGRWDPSHLSCVRCGCFVRHQEAA